MIFLWVFLPMVLLGNYILSADLFSGKKQRMHAKNLFLLLASFIFYGWGGIYYLALMIFSILLNYTGGRLIFYRCRNASAKRRCLAIVIALNLVTLYIFKYFNMTVTVIENILDHENGSVLGMTGTGALGLPHIVLPIGISFFTFQAMSYVIDVYRGDAPVQDDLFDFALYVSFFPQLIAGPIVRYHEVADQIGSRKETALLRASGIKRFCYGLGKKVLLANVFAETADRIFSLENSSLAGLTAWLGIICYTLQIYYDFSGYSDMAIGLGRMFGFRFGENFNYPYISSSVREFWRRWHISLSSWFREYVYIPLGGNRKGRLRTYINLFLVFLLTGFWHGANFTFIAWGIYYGILLIIERIFLGKILDNNPLKVLNHIYTMFAVIIGWVLVRSDNIYQAAAVIKGLFVFGENDIQVLSFLSMKLLVCLAAGILLCGPVPVLFKNWYERSETKSWVLTVDFMLQIAWLCLSVLSLVSGTYNPFIYFQF